MPDTELGLFAVALDAGQTDPCKVMTNVCLSWSERKGEWWLVPDSETREKIYSSIENRAGKAARLARCRKMTLAGKFCW
jgi:hypothetical protein